MNEFYIKDYIVKKLEEIEDYFKVNNHLKPEEKKKLLINVLSYSVSGIIREAADNQVELCYENLMDTYPLIDEDKLETIKQSTRIYDLH